MSPASPVYENLVTIHIDLGKDFKHLVDQEMESELAVAQQKWGVSLNGDDSDRETFSFLMRTSSQRRTGC